MASFRNRTYLAFVLASLLWGTSLTARAHSSDGSHASVSMGASAGIRHYRAGTWGVVAVEAFNPTDEAAELYSAVYVRGDPQLQYARRIWVPAESVIRSTCPIHIPDSLAPSATHVEVVSADVNPVDGTDALGGSLREAIDESRQLIVTNESKEALILGDFDLSDVHDGESPIHMELETTPRAPDDPIRDVVIAAKLSQGLSIRVGTMNAWELPANPVCLDALDVAVLCSNRLVSDPNATTLLRNWVLDGGCLWVMLDELEDDSLSALFGDSIVPVVVDRGKLTNLEIEDVQTELPPEDATILTLDYPVPFVRALPNGAIVTDKVNGWPAVFFQQFGAGIVVFTTLGAEAWCRPANPNDPRPIGTSGVDCPVARRPLRRLAARCFSRGHSEPVAIADFQPFLARQIGYTILSKTVVAAVLAVFCTVLLVAGGLLWKSGRSGRLLWVGPLASGLTSLVFLSVAVTGRNSVPPTVALLQLVSLEPGVATGHVRGLASIYSPEICDSEVSASRDGICVPDTTAMSGQRRRMVWTGEGAWHWEGVEFPPGIQTAPFEHMIHFEGPIDCRARFGPSGVTGLLAPLSTRLEDVVIAVPREPLLATKIRGDGSFVSGTDDVLSPGEFVAGTLLTDVQQARSDVYQAVVTQRSGSAVSMRPVLYAWTDAIDPGFTFPHAKQFGSALISIPVRLEPSPKGCDVKVPAPFLPYRSIVGPDGRPPTAYSWYRHEWGKYKTATTEWLRFQLPRQVLPIELNRAEISLDIRSPSRPVDLLGLNGEEVVVIKTLVRPVGTFHATVDQPELLQLDERGGLRIGIRVGDDNSADRNDLMALAVWEVKSLQVSVAGKTLGE